MIIMGDYVETAVAIIIQRRLIENTVQRTAIRILNTGITTTSIGTV
jgi:hypothetical protein